MSKILLSVVFTLVYTSTVFSSTLDLASTYHTEITESPLSLEEHAQID